MTLTDVSSNSTLDRFEIPAEDVTAKCGESPDFMVLIDICVMCTFSAASTRPPLVSSLPHPPNTWDQMLSHHHADAFREAANLEISQLTKRHTWDEIKSSDVRHLNQTEYGNLRQNRCYKHLFCRK
ncbi:hypothetical protein N7495_004517 [Penicillium taxi]|uniref:uncharacterized protein n=1 Tax=Penicillium taxi TaxID=168475 RepID=UPI002545ABE2|nr:uncharacterized protein N7495_004517 [Penicillium taxi]KAJ5899773.1 hypothetical protein N7495_004517 [Penicillium taxi]